MFLWTDLFAIIVVSTIFDTSIAISRKKILEGNEEQSFKDKYNFEDISAACINFTNSLYKSLLSYVPVSTGKNVIISPLNLYITLSLFSNGTEGLILNELKSVLHFNDTISFNNKLKALIVLLDDIKSSELRMTNTAYVEKEIEFVGDFLTMHTNNFISFITKMDFRNNTFAVKIINLIVQVVSNTLFDVISSDDIDNSTTFLLINTAYFKTRWLYIFDEKDTREQIFHASATKKYIVPTMFKESLYEYGIIQAWSCRFIEIPYTNKDMVMIILLPDRDITLEILENNFNWQTLMNIHTFPDPILLYLPKFKFEITIDLKDTLRKIGLNMMFEDLRNFTRLSKFPLKMDNVLQKIIIEVDEKGSEIPATNVDAEWDKQYRRSTRFMVNRPFMFAIKHIPTQTPLFLGSVRIPHTNNTYFIRDRSEL